MWICIAHRREHASDALPLTVCWRWSPPPIPQCREIGSSPWFNKAACATLESRIIASVNLDVMVRWPSLLCRRQAPYMAVESTLESRDCRDCRWTSSPADRLNYQQNVSRLSTCIYILVEENVPLWSTWQDSLENLINSDVSTVCAPLWISCTYCCK